MSINPSDKVICINDARYNLNKNFHIDPNRYTWPNGFIKKGQSYCVEAVTEAGYMLIGYPILLDNEPIYWHPARFKKMDGNELLQTIQNRHQKLSRTRICKPHKTPEYQPTYPVPEIQPTTK